MSLSRMAAVFTSVATVIALTGCSSATSSPQGLAATSATTSLATTAAAPTTPQQGSPSSPSNSTRIAPSESPAQTSPSMTFVAKGQTYAPVIDGVHVKVTSDYIPVPPSGLTNVSHPGGPVQHASEMVGDPYREFDLSAVAYGRGVYGEPAFPNAGPGVADKWRQVEIAQSNVSGQASNGPVAVLFGKSVVGTVVHRQDAPLSGKQIHIERIFWIVDAGNRIWELSIERDETGLPAGYGTGIEITASDLSTPTTM